MSDKLDGDWQVAVLSSAPSGGAGIASFRLCQALREYTALDVDFVDREMLGGLLPEDVAPPRSFSNRKFSDTHFSVEYPGFARGWVLELLKSYDLVNVHWASALVSLAELEALSAGGQSVVFTFHDFHYATGGCHYPAGCSRMALGCYPCPQLDRNLCSPAIPRKNRSIKQAIFSRENVQATAPSCYVRDRIVESGLVPSERAHVIRNPYHAMLSPALNQESGARILLIADSLYERRKNMAVAIEAVCRICETKDGIGAEAITIDLVGEGGEEAFSRLQPIGARVVRHGRVSDQQALAEIYRRSDILLTASTEDNWPNILVEAGAYGCIPVVGPGHGCEEFVYRYDFGVVAQDYRPDSFADALLTAVHRRSTEYSLAGLDAIRRDHDPETIARQFQEKFCKR